MLFKLRPYKRAVHNQGINCSGQIRCRILALSKYFDTLRKHAIRVARNIQITVPNDSHTITHCKYERDLLRNF